MKSSVSVIIPVYNGERTLARAIDSALAQTWKGEIEIVVADDGSTDSTADVLARYAGKITALQLPHSGVAAARNRAIEASHGELIAFLDADDVWMPKKLTQSVTALEEKPGCVLVYHDAIEVDSEGRAIRTSCFPIGHSSPPSLRDLLSGTFPHILTCNVVMRRAVVIRAGGFNERLVAFEDFAMWVAAREQGAFRYLPEVLARCEWEPSEHRDNWYIEGAYDFHNALHALYGGRLAARSMVAMLNSAGTNAMLRGKRALACRRYLSSLRFGLAHLQTWLRLFSTMLPLRLFARIEHRRRIRTYGLTDRSVAAATGLRQK